MPISKLPGASIPSDINETADPLLRGCMFRAVTEADLAIFGSEYVCDFNEVQDSSTDRVGRESPDIYCGLKDMEQGATARGI